MRYLDSNNDFAVTGKVLSLFCGNPKEIDYETDLITMVISSDNLEYIVDLPIKVKSDFELIPYQAVLIGVEVKYSKKYEEGQEDTIKNWKLELLSGPLKGNNYKFEEFI